MLIDDDGEDQEIFLTALEIISKSIALTTISDARHALQQLSRQPVSTDLIFLDLNMPMMSGQQFLTELKDNKTLSHIPVIVLSTSSNSKTIEQTKSLGARDFITKPDTFDDLIRLLRLHIS